MASLIDRISDWYNNPSPEQDPTDSDPITSLVLPPDVPVRKYGWSGAMHNQILSMINPHALGQPSMLDRLTKSEYQDPKNSFDTAMGLAGSFAGITEPVFHGTAAPKFTKFSNDKIGSGEGNQSYGYGHYLATNPSIANSYKMSVGKGNGSILTAKVLPDSDQFLDLDKSLSSQSDYVKSALDSIKNTLGFDSSDNITGHKMINYLENNVGDPSEISNALASAGIKGNKYLDASSRAPLAKVKYNGDTTDPLVQQGLDILNNSGIPSRWEVDPITLHKRLIDNYTDTYNSSIPEKSIAGGREGLAQKITALKSLDPNLINGLDQTHNYVVFNPDDIRITHWNDQPVEEVQDDMTFKTGGLIKRPAPPTPSNVNYQP